jgi:hypothetical protein
MTSNHADFYLGTKPDARWLGSLADLGGPVELSRLASRPAASGATLLAASDPDAYERSVASLLADQLNRQVAVVALPGLGDESGWPWLAATSAGWWAYSFTRGRVLVSFHGGPWFAPDPHRPDGGVGTATGPDADLPYLGATAPKTATFTYTFRGSPIPITTDLPPVPQTYLVHRVKPALAVAGAAELVLGRRWPLADLAATAIREAMLGQLRPGPDSDLNVLPDCAPFAHERVVTALQFLLDADRYAEGNNPNHAATLLTSAAAVAAQAVTAHEENLPYPPAMR